MNALMDDMFGDGWNPDGELHNLFFALIPSDEAKAEILARGKVMARRLGLHLPMRNDTLHMTLCPAGQPKRLRQPLPLALSSAAGLVKAEAIDIQLVSAARFGGGFGKPSLVLKAAADATLELKQALAAALLAEGLEAGSVRSGNPHVTIAYSAGLPDVEEPIEPICWTAREFVLIDSHVGKSRHEILGRWILS